MKLRRQTRYTVSIHALTYTDKASVRLVRYDLERPFLALPYHSTFTITPSFTDPNSAILVHKFDPASRTVTLDAGHKIVSSQNFIDSTAIFITGKTVQTCLLCLTGGDNHATVYGPKTCPVQGVEIGLGKNGTQLNRVFSQTDGFFATSVGNPGTYQITAKKGSLVFAPQTVDVKGSVKDLVFSSPTSQTITGRDGLYQRGERPMPYPVTPSSGST